MTGKGKWYKLRALRDYWFASENEGTDTRTVRKVRTGFLFKCGGAPRTKDLTMKAAAQDEKAAQNGQDAIRAGRVWRPVKREGARTNVLVTLVSFAASVVLTRLYLQLTGYPQIGSGTLHFAHVLWGGLLLYIASLLPLILANRWVYTACSILSGVGVGLFIDEVGKFITRSNDYFYPAAAPIIYAFFLLTVLLYLQVRRPASSTPRAELYRAFDAMTEVLDHDMEAHERIILEDRLRWVIAHSDSPDLTQLARALLDFLALNTLYVAPTSYSPLERLFRWVAGLEVRHVGRRGLRVLLVLGFGALGLLYVADLSVLLAITLGPVAQRDALYAQLTASAGVSGIAGMRLLAARLILEGLTGVLLLIADVFLLTNRDRRAITVSRFGLLMSLTTVDLLVFYFDQFQAVAGTIFQACLLLLALYYLHRYVNNEQGTVSLRK